MSLTYTNPMSELRDQVNRIFSEFGEEPLLPGLLRSQELPLLRGTFTPPLELIETEKDVVVSAALPGIKAEDIHVEVVGNTLMISGEYKRQSRQNEKRFHRSEFQYGHFQRRIPLPDYVQGERAQAEFKDGLLELHLPKVEGSQRKQIQVKAGK